MPKIAVFGNYGEHNIGYELILYSIIRDIRAQAENADIVVLCPAPRKTCAFPSVEICSSRNPLEIIKALIGADLFVFGGGPIFGDPYKFGTLLGNLGMIFWAKAFGKPVFLYGQGIGEVKSRFARFLSRNIMNGVDRIAVRDEVSKNGLENLQITTPVVDVTDDPVLNLVEDEFPAKNLNRGNMKVGVNVRKWVNEEKYKVEIAKAMDGIIEKYKAKISFIPFEIIGDASISRDIISIMENEAEVLMPPYEFSALKELFGEFDVMIGMRFHFLIMSSIAGIPFVSVSYSPKIEDFTKSLDQKLAGNAGSINEKDILDSFAEVAENYEKYRRLMIERLVPMKTEAGKTAKIAVGFLL